MAPASSTPRELPWTSESVHGPEDPLAALARAAAGHDEAATRALFRAIGPSVIAILHATLGKNDGDTDDLAQEILVAVLQALNTFRFECSVAHFARRIAVQRAMAMLRHRRAARRSSAATVVRDDVGEVFESGELSPLDEAIRARQLAHFRDLLTTLPHEQAEALALQVLGHSVEEIARQTRAPVNTVRGRLRAARATLRVRISTDPHLAELWKD